MDPPPGGCVSRPLLLVIFAIKAIHLSGNFCRQIETETGHAEKPLKSWKDMLAGRNDRGEQDALCLGRSQTAAYLGITIDTLLGGN